MIALVVAAAENNAIGKSNQLLWHLPNDLKFFKNTTWGAVVIMGRKTFEKVMSFGIEWPYPKPVFVWSQSLQQLPENLPKNVSLISGSPLSIHQKMIDLGFHSLYIDGGQTIQSFLQANLIDELTITTVPVLLGDGIPLFGKLDNMKRFKCCQTRLFNNGYVMNQFVQH